VVPQVWAAQTCGTAWTLNDVWGTDTNNVWAVSGSGRMVVRVTSFVS